MKENAKVTERKKERKEGGRMQNYERPQDCRHSNSKTENSNISIFPLNHHKMIHVPKFI